MAGRFGIHGFCYYHYWFNGRRLLERPFNEVLASGEPDYPFCLCWANENWTRRWDGGDDGNPPGQAYAPDDDLAHIRSLLPAFSDSRYIRVDGKPLFLVYRASLLPDPRVTTKVWREAARAEGIGELFLCFVESFISERRRSPAELGFDAAVGLRRIGRTSARSCNKVVAGTGYAACASRSLHSPGTPSVPIRPWHASPWASQSPPYDFFPCVTPGWDNTAQSSEQGDGFHGLPWINAPVI